MRIALDHVIVPEVIVVTDFLVFGVMMRVVMRSSQYEKERDAKKSGSREHFWNYG